MNKKYDILIEPAPILRKKAEEVRTEDIQKEAMQTLIKKMAEILFATDNGVGLAAPQIGISKRLFIALKKEVIQKKEEERKENTYGTQIQQSLKENTIDDILVFINPVIINHAKKRITMDEGCLSVPNMYGHTKRYEKVTVQAYDEKGKKFQRGTTGILAQIVQHEIDHLNGVLFIDHATNLLEIKKMTKTNYEL